MKQQELTRSKLLSTLLVMILLLFVSSIHAQNVSIKDLSTNKYALQNLLAGIKSDNEGVKRSCIYFAGKYRIAETEATLIEQLDKEENPSTKILIALVLYGLGSEKGLELIKKLAVDDENLEVRRMSTHIQNEHLINDPHPSKYFNE